MTTFTYRKERLITVRMDGPYEGVEAVVDAGMTTREYEERAEILSRAQGNEAEAVRLLVDMLAARLKGWNLVDEDGQPIGTSLETLLDLDVVLVVGLAARLLQGVAERSTVPPVSSVR